MIYMYKTIVPAFLICLVFGIFHIMSRFTYSRLMNKRIRWRRLLCKSLHKSFDLFKILIVISFCSLVFRRLSGNMTDKSNAFDSQYYVQNYNAAIYEKNDLPSILEEHRDELLPLSSRIYGGLSREERIDSLQIYLNCVLSSLGCENECSLASEVMPEYKLGYYDDSLHIVVISDLLLMSDNSLEACSTILHEAYHAYQNEIVTRVKNDSGDNIIVTYEISQYDREINNYANYDPYSYNSDKSFEEYSNQFIEASANCFEAQWRGYIVDFLNGLESSR